MGSDGAAHVGEVSGERRDEPLGPQPLRAELEAAERDAGIALGVGEIVAASEVGAQVAAVVFDGRREGETIAAPFDLALQA